MTDNNFNKLGNQFQQSLIKSIIEDPKYGDQIIEVLDSKYFDNSSFKYIVQIIKEHTETYRKIPNYVTIKQKISEDTSGNPLAGKLHTDTIREIENLEEIILGATYVKDTAMNFCKQQNLVKTLKKVDVIVNNGEFQNYEKIQEMIVEAMQVGTSDDDIVDISDDLESALDKDTRTPIATGISGLDDLLRGGLGHGELGMVIAPTGVGKSTILTKFANTAVNHGFKVVQIFFEDRESEIRKKHYTIWSGKPSDWQTASQENKDYVVAKVAEVTSSPNFGQLKLQIPVVENVPLIIKNHIPQLLK